MKLKEFSNNYTKLSDTLEEGDTRTKIKDEDFLYLTALFDISDQLKRIANKLR